jgi:hypothetical protein
MAFQELMDKAHELTGSAVETAGKLVQEFNEALPTMQALGFTLKDLRVGTGLTPEIGAKLVASTDKADAKKIKELIEKNPPNKTLLAVLKGLQAAYRVKEQLADFPFGGVEVDLTLGLPARVSVAFVSAAPAMAPRVVERKADSGEPTTGRQLLNKSF